MYMYVTKSVFLCALDVTCDINKQKNDDGHV